MSLDFRKHCRSWEPSGPSSENHERLLLEMMRPLRGCCPQSGRGHRHLELLPRKTPTTLHRAAQTIVIQYGVAADNMELLLRTIIKGSSAKTAAHFGLSPDKGIHLYTTYSSFRVIVWFETTTCCCCWSENGCVYSAFDCKEGVIRIDCPDTYYRVAATYERSQLLKYRRYGSLTNALGASSSSAVGASSLSTTGATRPSRSASRHLPHIRGASQVDGQKPPHRRLPTFALETFYLFYYRDVLSRPRVAPPRGRLERRFTGLLQTIISAQNDYANCPAYQV